MMLADICQMLGYITILCLRDIFAASGLRFPCFVTNIATVTLAAGYFFVLLVRVIQLISAFSGPSKLSPGRVRKVKTITRVSFGLLLGLFCFVAGNQGPHEVRLCHSK